MGNVGVEAQPTASDLGEQKAHRDDYLKKGRQDVNRSHALPHHSLHCISVIFSKHHLILGIKTVTRRITQRHHDGSFQCQIQACCAHHTVGDHQGSPHLG
jgi:hypothetical protein